MPEYLVTDPETGRKVKLTGDSPPTEEELQQIFSEVPRGTSALSIPGQIGEGIVDIGSRVIAEPAAGIAGIIGATAGALPGGETGAKKGNRFLEATREFLTLEADSPVGQGIVQTVGELGEGAVKVARTLPAGAVRESLQEQGIESDIPEQILSEGIGPFLGEAAALSGAPPSVSAGLEALPTAIAAALGFGVGRGLPRQVRSDVAEVERRAIAEGIDLDQATPENIRRIQTIADELTGEQKARIAEFREAGITQPTRAQVTRDPGDFQTQQELSKGPGRVRSTLEGQEAQLSRRFDEGIEATQGRPIASGSSVVDEIVGRSTKLDDQISELYRRARAEATDQVDLSGFTKKVMDNLDSDAAADGLFSAVRGELKRRGVIDESGNVSRVDVATAEEIRKFINAQFDGRNRTFTNSQIHALKESLDQDVFKAAGRDIFQEARQAKASFEQELSNAKISRFDRNNRSLVRDILENKIDPEVLVQRITASRSYRANDLRQLRDYLHQSQSGRAAFDDLRAQVLDSIKQKAFTGAEDANGFRSLSRAALERELGKIGADRMEVLFTVTERSLIENILKVAKLREPVRGTALGQGPSAQAVISLRQQLANNSIVARLLDTISVNRSGQVLLQGRVQAPQITVGPGAQGAVPLVLSGQQATGTGQ